MLSATSTVALPRNSTPEFVNQWEGENEWGLQGAYDPEVRDPVLDADGVAGEVIFADGDAVTGQESPPFGAGLAAGQITDPRQAFGGARAQTAGWRSSAPPTRYAGLA
ncbi:MAG: hypothetical protein Ct9H300mP12_04520 [Acidimicrobiales bacterium]|nr:MAG: hypothetical protein Ct9H300mP12_04520 [Acidimicrobiales bacterium]